MTSYQFMLFERIDISIISLQNDSLYNRCILDIVVIMFVLIHKIQKLCSRPGLKNMKQYPL